MNPVLRYHDATKHHYGRFARSRGYLDWATQPDPFRRYAGAHLIDLPRAALAVALGGAAPFDVHSVGEFLRCSMGLSAWKQAGASRWALRVNPSSGNLHPTEAYVVWQGRVCHYAPREHALEERCTLGPAMPDTACLVVLTSIHWREAWKYGERAFRYCQHDVGHAIGALHAAASLLGWRLMLLPRWSDDDVAALVGVDRLPDYVGAEREHPDCVAVVTAGDPAEWLDRDPRPLVEAAATAVWSGQANRLSPDHVEWPIIDEVADATRLRAAASGAADRAATVSVSAPPAAAPAYPRSLIVQRRSALGFDPRGALRREAFVSMLARVQPPDPEARLSPGASPWDAIDWSPHVHLILFVHRVQDVTPGIYAYLRDGSVLEEWRTAMRSEFVWEAVRDPQRPAAADALYLLAPLDVRHIARRLSCDQDIAGDGFFSLGMIARFEGGLRDNGDWFYRRLFWECGLIGQVLYLEAEAVGARATGIGCFYDDPVHELLGLTGHPWQSLYHFSMGLPVDDDRLTTAPGYAWDVEP